MKKIISPITGKSKYLLIENCEVISDVRISKDLKESLKLSAGKNGTLVVRNLPGTILNRENQNGRIYSTQVLAQAIQEAKPLFETKQLLSQADEHPEGSFVAPSHASHVVTNAYIKRNVNVTVDGEAGNYDMLFMDIEVLNTEEGKNLRALLEAECSVGTSIRGVGDMEGKYVKNYEILGIDFVGNPSSSTFTRMPVSESVQVEVKDPRSLQETFTVTTSSTNVVRDLEQAAQIQQQLEGIGYGTVTKTSTKLDQETDPKTGAQTSITTLEAETSDDVSDLDQALQMARNAMLNGTVNVDSITIENVQEEEPKESVEEVTYEPEDEKEPIADATMTEAKKEDEEDPNLGKKFVLHTDRGFVTYDKNAIDFTDKPEEALHFREGKEESGMVSMSKVTEILDAMGIFDVQKYFQKTSTNLGANEKQPAEEGAGGSAVGGAVGLVVGTAMGAPISGTRTGANIGSGIQDGTFPEGSSTMNEENGSNTKYRATIVISDQNGAQTEQVPVSSVDLESAQKEISNLWDMKQKSLSGNGTVDIKLTDTITGQEVHFNPETKLFENTLTEGDNPVEVKDDTVTVELDDDDKIEKEFDSPLQAKVAVDAVAQGKADPKVLVPEAAPVQDEYDTEGFEDPTICSWCKEMNEKSDCKKEKDLGWLCPQCQDALRSRGVNLCLDDDFDEEIVDEKLYSNPSEPSDGYEKETLTDALGDELIVTIDNLDWDIDEVDPNFLSQIENLPDSIDVKIKGDDVEAAESMEAVKQLLLANANSMMNPFKIKDGVVGAIKDAQTGEILA